jgi:hypothetical protein
VLVVAHMVIESVELETDGRGQEVLVARGRGQGCFGVALLALPAALPGL